MKEEPFVHKIFVGQEQELDGSEMATNPMERPWKSSIFKQEVEDPIWLGKSGLTGDYGADSEEKSQQEKAVYVYPIKHYAYWQEVLHDDSLEYGMMGENFSVLEMDEFSVCIGDIYQYGDLCLQVAQPHQPNWEIARRFQEIELARKMQDSGRTGWYFRVLQEGMLAPRVDIELIDRPYPEWTIAACNEVMHQDKKDWRRTEQLAACDLLSVNWKQLLKARLRGRTLPENKRLYGPNKI